MALVIAGRYPSCAGFAVVATAVEAIRGPSVGLGEQEAVQCLSYITARVRSCPDVYIGTQPSVFKCGSCETMSPFAIPKCSAS